MHARYSMLFSYYVLQNWAPYHSQSRHEILVEPAPFAVQVNLLSDIQLCSKSACQFQMVYRVSLAHLVLNICINGPALFPQSTTFCACNSIRVSTSSLVHVEIKLGSSSNKSIHHLLRQAASLLNYT